MSQLSRPRSHPANCILPKEETATEAIRISSTKAKDHKEEKMQIQKHTSKGHKRAMVLKQQKGTEA
ncbi:hypothetical protein F2Q69_00053132 [Brassica cretica]|uniref:Uncharacterized protein n=1 Tax=Brassica cretica TaxID=69181 RepID=A0A8S9MVA8_BRACR|nr:hypothetical protein F2Q69_00053132 [Brassica cretica]